eukprot:m.201222 g.201222  ORF g.201222 m.201222 type:complete len:333 (-) comp10674_c0_seq1:1951-2949(-)
MAKHKLSKPAEPVSEDDWFCSFVPCPKSSGSLRLISGTPSLPWTPKTRFSRCSLVHLSILSRRLLLSLPHSTTLPSFSAMLMPQPWALSLLLIAKTSGQKLLLAQSSNDTFHKTRMNSGLPKRLVAFQECCYLPSLSALKHRPLSLMPSSDVPHAATELAFRSYSSSMTTSSSTDKSLRSLPKLLSTSASKEISLSLVRHQVCLQRRLGDFFGGLQTVLCTDLAKQVRESRPKGFSPLGFKALCLGSMIPSECQRLRKQIKSFLSKLQKELLPEDVFYLYLTISTSSQRGKRGKPSADTRRVHLVADPANLLKFIHPDLHSLFRRHNDSWQS